MQYVKFITWNKSKIWKPK